MDDDKNKEAANRVEEFCEQKMDNLAIADKVDRSAVPVSSDDNELDENEQLHSASVNCSNNSVQPQPANLTFTKTKETEDVTELNAVVSNQPSRHDLTYSYKTDSSADLSPIASDTACNVPTNIPQLQIPSMKSIANEVRLNLIVGAGLYNSILIYSQWFVVKWQLSESVVTP